MPPVLAGREPLKSWKKINEERKALKKQRKQEKLLRELEKNAQSELDATSAKKTQAAAKSKLPPSTISIAVPGSILENAQSAELRCYVAGQIARAACIFRVSEIIVFDDVGVATARETKRNYDKDDAAEEGTVNGSGGGMMSATVRSSCLQLARILQYLECPQYLRKFFFPLHNDLKYSGLLNPLDTPHHLRLQNVFLYREGIITEKKAKDGFSYVNAGLLNDVLVNKAIKQGVRVTVRLDNVRDNNKKLRGTVVSPDEPRRETGVYWGYTVRIAHSLVEIFTKSPFAGGYDLTVGTSDRGTNIHEVPNRSYDYNHLLVVFGGLRGLEEALLNDEKLNVDDPALLFDHYINVLPRQGSRTIRTEEAILIALAALQEKLQPKVKEVEENLDEYQLPRSDDTGVRPDVIKNYKKRKLLDNDSNNTGMQYDQQVMEDTTFGEEDRNSPKRAKKCKKSKNESFNGFKTELKSQTKVSKQLNVSGNMNYDDFEDVAVNDSITTKAPHDLGDLSRFD